MELQVVETSISEAVAVLRQLPEFTSMPGDEYYQERIEKSQHLVLIALADSKPIGCKVGYDKFKDGSFYSWLGGILPQYRRLGIAKVLADRQEKWALSQGYKSIKFKTLNRHKGMILFAVKNGFDIYNVKSKDELENYRIEMIKDLQ